MQKVLETSSYRVHYEVFDSLDGLPGDFHNLGKKVIQGSDGRLWFGTSRGIAWLNPGHHFRRQVCCPSGWSDDSASGQESPLQLIRP